MADPTWTEPILLADIKNHLRVSSSDTSEDALLAIYAKAAREFCEGYQNRIYLAVGEDDVAETMNGIEKAACLLLIGHFYENRQAVVLGVTAAEVPFAVKALLDMRRNVPI